MEAGEIMLPRLGLPDWTVTFIIILLIVGFPIAVILSWIFDVTPEGFKKTEPVEVAKEKEIETKLNRRKLKAGDVTIVVLLVIVGILVYPKIFNRDKLASLRDEEGRISIAVMPFENMTNDTTWNAWQGGIQNELITALSNSKELSVRQYQSMMAILRSSENMNSASIRPSVAGEISRKLQVNTFIQGTIKTAGEKFRINAHLIDADSEEIFNSFQIDGLTKDDIFLVIDSLAMLVQDYLEIKVLDQDVNYDIRQFRNTDSPEAYRFFIQGMNLFYGTNFSSAIESFNKALEIDTNFTSARILSIFALGNLGRPEEAKLYLQKAYERIEDVSYVNQLLLKYLKSMYDKDPYAGIKYSELVLEYDPQTIAGWYQQGWNYYQMHQYEKAVEYFEKALEVDQQYGGGFKFPGFYSLPGRVHHDLGNHDREQEIYERGLSVLPEYPGIIYRQAVCTLSQGDTIEANKLIEKYRSIREQEGGGIWALFSVGRIYEEADYLDKAEKIFRQANDIDNQNAELMNGLAYFLIKHEINVNEGMELITRAIEIEPEKLYFLYTKGFAYHKQGKVKEAHEILKKTWDLRPRYDHEHFLLLQEVEQALASQDQ